ncbi:MAG: dihydrofolate reductase [Paludibacteraceae bacterium]|nr:dihydrofolate reductase [Paludibacteraceae bacterium]
MKITLYMAISIDGFITKGLKDSSWVSKSDWEQFYSYINVNDAIVMGRKTKDQFDADEFPVEGVYNIVLSRNPNLHKNTDALCIMAGSPADVVTFAKQRGYKKYIIT